VITISIVFSFTIAISMAIAIVVVHCHLGYLLKSGQVSLALSSGCFSVFHDQP
jgi:hypothetical protein